MRSLSLLIAVVVTFLFSCTKENTAPSPAPPNPAPPAVPVISPSVYVAGDSLDARSGMPRPRYWKNGQAVNLHYPVAAQATSIAVKDTNVYVTTNRIFLGSTFTYWKNSVGVDLAETSVISPTILGVALSGTDLYMVGTAHLNYNETSTPIYSWKNEGQAAKTPTVNFSAQRANNFAVAGNDIYITGEGWDPATGYGYTSACYWKNGSPAFLHSPTSLYTDGIAKSVAVSGTDVHVVGNITYRTYAPPLVMATHWKNGIATELTKGFERSIANDISVVGNDVYIAGGILGADGLPRAAYWKNGVVTKLETTYSEAKAITVYNNDVYVAGDRGSDVAVYWKNGQPVVLGKGRANDIVVVK